MKALLYAAVATAAMVSMAMANPIQVNKGTNPAQAQVYGDGSSANANQAFGGKATSHSSSQSKATGGNARATGGRANARGGAGGSASSNQTVNVNGAGGSSGSGTYDGPRFVPSPYAPDIISGGCTGAGASGSATTGFFGLSFGRNRTDKVCQLHMIGQDAAAKELMCEDSDVRQAFKAAGEPCAADQVVPVAATVISSPGSREYRYDWCLTASPGELRQHKECFTKPKG